MQVYNIVFLKNKPMNTNFVSSPLQLTDMFGYAIQLEWSNTANGAFKLQASNDSSLVSSHQGTWPVNWNDIANSTVTVTTDGSVFWNVTDVMYNYVRVVFTDASGGTSTAIMTTATFNGKGA